MKNKFILICALLCSSQAWAAIPSLVVKPLSGKECITALGNIGKVVHRISGEYASPLTLDSLARTANMSRRNFTRRFREITGYSCSRYITLFRLRQALEMMKNPDNDLGQIALSCGFCDSNYLCKQFRQVYGESPGSYRKRFTP